MAFAIDTNILVALWGGSEEEQEAAGNALTRASSFGSLTICGAV